MLRKISGRFSPKLICLFLSIIIGFSIGIGFSKPEDIDAAGAWVSYSDTDNWGDGRNFKVELNKGDFLNYGDCYYVKFKYGNRKQQDKIFNDFDYKYIPEFGANGAHKFLS